MSPVLSVIVPVHNEAKILARCFDSLRADIERGAEVVVVCNGCTDNSAARARELLPNAKVIETTTGGKANALNLGDQAATAAERHYLDADVELSPGAVFAVHDAMKANGWLSSAPEIILREVGPWAVRSFLRIWKKSPYFQSGMIGAGYYAMTESGRKRFGAFPRIKADDHFVYSLFEPHERGVTRGATFEPLWPNTLRDLYAVEVRHYAARMEYNEALAKGELPRTATYVAPESRWLADEAKDPRELPAIAAYAALKVATRLGGMREHRFGDKNKWTRDKGSRGE